MSSIQDSRLIYQNVHPTWFRFL